MYYVLFTWVKGKKERDFQGFRTKPKLIDFLGKNFEKIIVWNIHEAGINYRFGLYEKESKPEEEGGAFLNDPTEETAEEKEIAEIKEKEEEPDEEKPADYLGALPPAEQKAAVEEEAERESKKHPYIKNKKEEPSAMEKIADDIEKEQEEEAVGPITEEGLTDAEIIAQNKKKLKKLGKAPTLAATLSRGEKAIAAAEKEQAKEKTAWRICKRCDVNRISPMNRSGVCTPCQLKRKTNRPYKRKAKF